MQESNTIEITVMQCCMECSFITTCWLFWQVQLFDIMPDCFFMVDGVILFNMTSLNKLEPKWIKNVINLLRLKPLTHKVNVLLVFLHIYVVFFQLLPIHWPPRNTSSCFIFHNFVQAKKTQTLFTRVTKAILWPKVFFFFNK